MNDSYLEEFFNSYNLDEEEEEIAFDLIRKATGIKDLKQFLLMDGNRDILCLS